MTVVLSLSTERLNRLPFQLDRWKGPMSLIIQCNEDEIRTVTSIISTVRRSNIRFTLYILKDVPKGQKKCSFVTLNTTVINYDSCFAYNVLRDLAIESIQTTHYLILDGDAILSSIMNE